MLAYKSYCWSLGTTSFRMVEFNRKIEKQLQLLNQFWQKPENVQEHWSSNNAIQTEYYNFIREHGFIEEKDAPRKDKDARQKTSGLVDLGIINDERRLTEAGLALRAIAESGNFSRDNILRIPTDSFIYFRQLLKFSCPFENGNVRPYVVLAYILSEIGEISKSKFTYLLPLAINTEKTERVVEYIKAIRRNNATIDDAIISIISEMANYQEAKKIFIEAAAINEKIIQEIGMNRKSRAYDIPYTDLCFALQEFRTTPDTDTSLSLFDAVDKISGRARTYWKMYLFNSVSRRRVEMLGIRTVKRDKAILTINNEIGLKRNSLSFYICLKPRVYLMIITI